MKDKCKQILIGLMCLCLAIGIIFVDYVYAVPNDVGTIPGLSPTNTTIDLFDYAHGDFIREDNNLSDDFANLGINKNKEFKFGHKAIGSKNESINAWTGKQSKNSGGPFRNIVQNRLKDGYPVLKRKNRYDENSVHLTSEQSLDYLFNNQSIDNAKHVYKDVKNLLTLNEDGFYSYDSQKNYAEFDEKNKSFILYDRPFVNADPIHVSDSQNGQFFPFCSLEHLRDNNGNYKPSHDGSLNHFFGLHMTSYFIQPKDGITANGKPMQFNFSGDDDVWVFIDGILVGDVGGIHDRLTLTIDFNEGKSVVQSGASYIQDGNFTYSTSSFKDLGLEVDDSKKRLKDGTYHTLDFFYLERGHGNSNLKLETNLVSIPVSELLKVDQLGNLIDGAQFKLYETGSDYVVVENQKPLAKGSTVNGKMNCVDEHKRLINFGIRYTENSKHQYYVLKEVKAPDGYRRIPDVKLRYDPQRNCLVCDNLWETGVSSNGSIVVTAPSSVALFGSTKTIELKKDTEMFAVILKRNKNIGQAPSNNDEWLAVSGDVLHGYKYHPIHDLNDIKNNDVKKYPFKLSIEGKYQLLIEELPGDLGKYFYNLSNNQKNKTEYSIGYYIYDKGLNGNNLYRIKTEDREHRFERVFGSRLILTDPKNFLFVQKIDDANRPLDGVEFTLYKESDVVNGQLKEQATAFDTVTTKTLTLKDDGVDLKGGAVFGKTKPLPEGIYYLKESRGKPGYDINEQLVKVVVNDRGVHADAGNENDGVKVIVGVGSLIDSMAHFGTHDNYNKTLTDINATLQTADKLNGLSLDWHSTNRKLQLTYNSKGAALQYGPTNEEKDKSFTFIVDKGYARTVIKQNYNDGVSAEYKESLGDKDLTRLYSGSTIVQMTNKQKSSLVVEKKVIHKPLNMNKDDIFKFEIQLQGNHLQPQYDIQIRDSHTQSIVDKKTLSFNQGKATFYLKDHQYLELLGVASGIKYEVQEILNNQSYQLDEIQSMMNVDQTFKSDLIKKLATGMIVDQTQHICYTNQYEYNDVVVSGNDYFSFKKLYNGWNQGKNDTFDIILEAPKGTPMPKGELISKENDYYVKKTVSKNNQSLSFGDITYSSPGEYIYFMKELKPAKLPAGVFFTPQTYKVVVKVTDVNQTGILSVSSKTTCIVNKNGEQVNDQLDSKNIALFENRFTTDQASVSFTGKKLFDGFSKKHDFYIKLTPKDNAPIPSKTIVKVNQDNPYFAFENIIFNQSHIGKTYGYTIEEVLDANGATLPEQSQNGITYDQSKYNVEVSVQSKTISGVKVIDANVSYTKNDKTVKDLIFTNHYQVKPLNVSIQDYIKIKKVLKGRELTNCEFAFELYDDNAQLIDIAKNNEKGEIIFKSLQFDKPGTYVYHVKEKRGDDCTISYDTNIFDIYIEVRDQGDGTLSVFKDNFKDIIFTNEYISPTIPNENEGIITPPNEGNKPPQMPQGGQTISPLQPNHLTEVGQKPPELQTNDQIMILPYFFMMLVSFSGIILLSHKYYINK